MFDPNSRNSGSGRRSLLDYSDDQTNAPDALSGEPSHAPSDAPLHDDTAAVSGSAHNTARLEALHRLRAEIGPGDRDAEDAISSNPQAQGRAEPRNPLGLHDDAVGDDGTQTAARIPPNGALIDPVVMIAAAWRYRLFVVFTTILGAAFGVMTALSTPHKFDAVSQFVLDPRELRLTETELLPRSYSTDAILALVDSQVQIVDSDPVLRAVVQDLKLYEDPEFNGEGSGGGIGPGAILGFVRSLFAPVHDGGAIDREFIALLSLSRAVSVYRGENTFIVYVDVRTEDPAKSALIANRIVNVYIGNQRESQAALFERTTAALNRQLDDLRKDVEASERRVEQYKAENDLVDAGGALISDEQIIRLNQQLAQVRAQKAEVQVRAESAADLNVDSLLAGTSPEILQSSTITELRAEYASAKRIADTLTTSLGPRHPQRIAAEQSLSTLRSEISNELRRIVESTQTELRRIVQSEQQLASDLAILKSKQVATSGDLVRLRELEREANATSQIYESFLKRARETREQQNLNTSNIRVISEATPPLRPTGPSRKFIAAGGMFVGFAVGLGITLMLGAYRSFILRFKGIPKSRPAPALAPERRDPSAVAPEAQATLPQEDTAPAAEGDLTTRNQSLQDVKKVTPAVPLLPANDDGLDSVDETGPRPQGGAVDEPSAFDASQPDSLHDEEAERIRDELNQMRELVEKLRQARRRASGDHTAH